MSSESDDPKEQKAESKQERRKVMKTVFNKTTFPTGFANPAE